MSYFEIICLRGVYMIGKALKYMRVQKKLSQDDISKVVLVARNTISQYETETIQPTFSTIEKIADICGYDVYFVSRKTDEKFMAKDIVRKDI